MDHATAPRQMLSPVKLSAENVVQSMQTLGELEVNGKVATATLENNV